ncbi:MAG: Rid family hydrolase [Acidimicrobiales bacterium]
MSSVGQYPPYSPWRRAGDFIIVSGQIGRVPETGELVEGGAAAELRQAIKNGAAVLHEAGGTLGDVVKATLFILDMNDFVACNEVWLAAFSNPRPTRSTVAVAELPLGAKAEIEFWAYSPKF